MFRGLCDNLALIFLYTPKAKDSKESKPNTLRDHNYINVAFIIGKKPTALNATESKILVLFHTHSLWTVLK